MVGSCLYVNASIEIVRHEPEFHNIIGCLGYLGGCHFHLLLLVGAADGLRREATRGHVTRNLLICLHGFDMLITTMN